MQDDYYNRHTPPTTPEEAFKDQPTMRRLCIFRFECPLCPHDHEAEFYITMPVDNLDDYVANLNTYARNWEKIEPTLTSSVIIAHQKMGDLHELLHNAKDLRFALTKPPTIELTDESDYTCDHCSRTFPSNEELHQHMEQCIKTT